MNNKIYAKNLTNKINALRNKRLKYALMLQKETGLRIAEIAKLKKEDLLFDEKSMQVFTEGSKRGDSRVIDVNDNMSFIKNIKEFVKVFKDDEYIFYKESYLKKLSYEKNIKTHELRYLFAQKTAKEMKEVKIFKPAVKQYISFQFGHKKKKNTNIYLTNREVIFDEFKRE